MAEPAQITFSFREIAESLVKKQGIHDGIWGLYFRFAIGAANVGPTEEEAKPTAFVPVVEMGLQKFDREGPLSVDASKVNPRFKKTKSLPARH